MFVRHKLNQAGDTIVEVLIAIAVISLVLTGAFVATDHNTKLTQDTEEHTQAQKLVESQIEFLRSSGTWDGSKTCFDSSGNAVTGAACMISPINGGTAYSLKIAAQPGLTYQISAVWDSLVGGKDNVTMYYRTVTP